MNSGDLITEKAHAQIQENNKLDGLTNDLQAHFYEALTAVVWRSESALQATFESLNSFSSNMDIMNSADFLIGTAVKTRIAIPLVVLFQTSPRPLLRPRPRPPKRPK